MEEIELLRETVSRFVDHTVWDASLAWNEGKSRPEAALWSQIEEMGLTELLTAEIQNVMGAHGAVTALAELARGDAGLAWVTAQAMMTRVALDSDEDLTASAWVWDDRARARAMLTTMNPQPTRVIRCGLDQKLQVASLTDSVFETKTRPLAFRAMHTATIQFDNLTWEDVGDDAFMPVAFLLCASAVAVGISKAALEAGRLYAQDRKQFGQPISSFQAIKWKVADSGVASDAAWVSVQQAANSLLMGDAAKARLLAGQAAEEAADHALQIHGGAGYVEDYRAERLYRDAQGLHRLGATTERLKQRIAEHALGRNEDMHAA